MNPQLQPLFKRKGHSLGRQEEGTFKRHAMRYQAGHPRGKAVAAAPEAWQAVLGCRERGAQPQTLQLPDQ